MTIKVIEDISNVTFRSNNPEWTRRFECMYYSCNAHPRSCFFCKHCYDIFYDYINGPYMFFCDLEGEDQSQEGIQGKCNNFKEDEE